MILNDMWGAPSLQQGTVQIPHLPMTSHDVLLFIKIYGCHVLTDRWYVLKFLWRGGGGFHCFLYLALAISWQQLHAVRWSTLLCVSNSSSLWTRSRNLTLYKLWTACTLKGRVVGVYFPWRLDKCCLTVIFCHHQI